MACRALEQRRIPPKCLRKYERADELLGMRRWLKASMYDDVWPAASSSASKKVMTDRHHFDVGDRTPARHHTLMCGCHCWRSAYLWGIFEIDYRHFCRHAGNLLLAIGRFLT